MAQFDLPVNIPFTKRGFPFWADEAYRKGAYGDAFQRGKFLCTPEGIFMPAETASNWYALPIAAKLPVNNFEVLVKVRRLYSTTSNYTNAGGAISFFNSEFANKTQSRALSAYVAVGTNTATGHTVYSLDEKAVQTQLTRSTSMAAIGQANTYFMRVRVEGLTLMAKTWLANNEEPTTWHSTVTLTKQHKLDQICYMNQGNGIMAYIEGIYIGTEGDTAQPLEKPITSRSFGKCSGTNPYYTGVVLFRDKDTHDVLDWDWLKNGSGTWDKELTTDRPYYVEILSNEKVERRYDFAIGEGYLGGDFPDGIVTIDGVPSSADMEIRLKSEDPILDNSLVATAKASQAGTWKVPGVSTEQQFNVIAKHEGEQDVYIPGVIAETDSSPSLSIDGRCGLHRDGYIAGRYKISGVPPYSVSVGPGAPFAFADSLVLEDDSLTFIYYPRDFGTFETSLIITDAQETRAFDLKLENLKRADVATIVGTAVSVSTTNTTSKTVTIPAECQEGDILVAMVLHRATTLSVSDNESGVWERVSSGDAAIYAMWTTALYRTATANSAGKTITFTGNSSTMLFVHLVVFRGKYLPLQVKQAIAGPARYDESYSTADKKLQPITGVSGFLYAAASVVYAQTTVANNIMILDEMSHIGVLSGAPSRFNSGYKMLGNEDTFEPVFFTAVSNSEDAVPHVYIILDEIRL